MIFVKNGDSGQGVLAQAFRDEAELERILVDCPDLISDEGDTALRVVATQVLLGGGYADVLLLDQEMMPTVVEVKLARNGESRREVVGQVFDYVSSLAEFTFDELNQLVNSRLQQAVERFCETDSDPDSISKARIKCGANLRAGNVRVVVVVDDAAESLIRVLRYMADHSDVDVRLISITKHGTSERNAIFVPRILVRSEENRSVAKVVSLTLPKEFAAVLEVYDAAAANELRTFGSAATYRFVRPQGWPARLHYEFVHYRSARKLGTELHVESDDLKNVSAALEGISIKATNELQGLSVEYDPKWSSNRGRLRVFYPESASPGEVAKGMTSLIEITRPLISALIRPR